MAPRAPARIIRASGVRRRAVPTRISTARTSTTERCDVPFGRLEPAICLIPRRCHDNSDGGFQFDFQQPEKPVRPTVPPIPGQETAAYSTEPTAQATPALQFPQSVQSAQSAQPTQPTQFVQPAQVAYASQPTQAVPTVQAAQPTQPIDPAMTQPFSPQFLAAVAAQAPQPAAATQPVVSETPIAAAPGQQQYVWDQTTQSFRPVEPTAPGDASSTSRTSGTGDIACFGSFKRRDTGVPTQSGRAACGRCRGNTSVPA